MGASNRSFIAAAACCLGFFASNPAVAESEGWLDRITSVTSSFIPDINLSAYLKGIGGADNDAAESSGLAGKITAPYGTYLWQFDGALGTDPADSGFRYTLVDSDIEGIGSSAGVYLLSMDPNTHSKVGGLARSAATESRFPTYGLDLAYAIAPRWSLGMRGYFLDIETSELDGSQSAYSAGVEYAARDDMSVGFGYEQFKMKADTQLQNLPGYVAYEYRGPRVYTTLRF